MNVNVIKFFLKYQKKHTSSMILIALLLFAGVILQLPMPLVTKYFIDTIIPTKNISQLNLLGVALFLILGVSQVINVLRRILLAKYKAKVHGEIFKDFYEHIQELPITYFTSHKTGYILSRVSEISAAEILMADTFLDIVKDVLTLSVGAVLILHMHFMIGIMALILLPFFIYSMAHFHKYIKKVTTKLHETRAKYTSKLESNINNIEKIKTEVQEEEESKLICKELSTFLTAGVDVEKINSIANSVAVFIGSISPFLVLWYGGLEIIKGNLTLGAFFAINTFISYLYMPAQGLTTIGYKISSATAGLDRVFGIFCENKEKMKGDPVNHIGSIEFKEIDFAYNNDEPILKNITLNIKEKEKVAIVGISGSGKSTLLKLLLKLILPNNGSIFISKKDIRTLDTKDLRRKIAYISQNISLLDNSIDLDSANNNTYRDFNIKNIITRENGADKRNFSHGEKQRIELALALLKEKNVDLLLLDEPTAHLDYESENIVMEKTFKEYRDKTIICVAHRLNAIKDFQRILVLSDGAIIESGTHEQLLKINGTYKSIWQKQFENYQK